jgi:signal transduction histidine kinase
MNAMLEELLDAARLEVGQALDLRLEPVDVGALIESVAAPRAAAMELGGPPVAVAAPAGLVVQADRARLERVLENLLDNAIKYSPRATPVHVTADRHGNGVIITVRDQGVGIPQDELPHVFVPFYRASTSRNVPGIGIGLAGAKKIVEQHGGEITVESALDQGTTVVITLPESPPPPSSTAPSPEGADTA